MMCNRFTDFNAYQSVYGDRSLYLILASSGTEIIRQHDEVTVFTINLETLEEHQYPVDGFFDKVPVMPLIVDDMTFMYNPEGAEAFLSKQIQAEEKCGFFRPK